MRLAFTGRMRRQVDLKYDAVIVGAGPAGCMAALKSPPGMRVLMIDRLGLPRNLICGGVLRPAVVARLSPYEIPESVYRRPKVIEWRLYDWELGRQGGFKNDIYFNVDRSRFDKWLLDMAGSREGVEVWPKTRFVGVQSGNGGSLGVTVSKDGKKINVEAGFLIGADGAASSVRRFLGRPMPRRWVAVQKTIRSQGATISRFLAFLGGGIDFYGWVVPKDDNLLVGAAYDSAAGNVLSRFEDFCRLLEEKHDIGGVIVDRTRARPAIRLRSLSEICSGKGNILLAGEAAGLLCPWSGEGISYAVASGSMAGEAVGLSGAPGVYRNNLRKFLPRMAVDMAGRKIMKRPHSRIIAASMAPWASLRKT